MNNNLDQVKKKSFRLLKLAKKTPDENGIPTLQINNLSKSREIIAAINGFKNWHEYHQDLEFKEFELDKKSKKTQLSEKREILEDLSVFQKIVPFVFEENKNELNHSSTTNKDKKEPSYSDNLLVGQYSDRHHIFGRIESIKKKDKPIYCDNFPIYMTGSCGSGKTKIITSFSDQFISRGEGLIYVEAKGDTSVYMDLFASCMENDRIEDFFLLNFYKSYNQNDQSSITHTIDFINPLIGNDFAFNLIAGDILSSLIHSLCLCIKNNNGLVNIENLNSFLSLDNINSFLANPLFTEAHEIIEDYLESISYFSDSFRSLKKHALNSIEYIDFLDYCENYKSMFSTSPDISIDLAYSKNKIVLILLPALEKYGPSKFYDLICLQILNRKYKNNQNNIFIDDSNYFIKPDIMLNEIGKHDSRRFIFASQNLYHPLNNILIEKSNTFILLKQEQSPDCKSFDSLKLKIFNNLENIPSIFKQKRLCDLNPGEGFVFSSMKRESKEKPFNFRRDEYYLLPLKAYYKAFVYPKYVFLNRSKMW